MKELAIIGAGSWGTALSLQLAQKFPCVRLWVYEKDLALRMIKLRENDLFLPGFQLPQNVQVETDIGAALKGADVALGVMPSHHARRLYTEMLPHLKPSIRIVSATKGIEEGTRQRMSEVIREVVSARFEPKVAVLSGPTFAREVARGEPAAVVIASEDIEVAKEIQAAFSGPSLRLYTNTDILGVEMAASLKNVIAIGAGVCHGLGLGNNTIAALITRGLVEMTRLAVAMGAQASTLSGLAGLGDLVLTCTGELSRNRSVGIKLARGHRLDEITTSMRMVAEGIKTTFGAVELGRQLGVDIPITNQMFEILRQGKPPREAVRELMERTLKPE